MGWETLLVAAVGGLQVASAVQEQKQANKQARATIEEGNIAAANKAKEIRAKAARAQVNFLNSGITLEGTPLNALTGVFDSGLEDIKLLSSNYNRAAANQVAAGRTAMLKGFAGAGMSVLGASSFPSFGATSAGVNSFASGTGFGTGVDVFNSVNNPANSGIF